ncbi:MAG: alkaline phosphatase family protein [Anaerolineae bacterium]|nr:alkaline phosphatase family protein [Anaerolineae bacterium]
MDVVALEHDLRTYRPEGMTDLPSDFIWPRYEGLSVGNLMGTVAQILGATLPAALPPLRSDLLDGMVDGVQRVVLLIMDGLGWEQLQSVMARHPDLYFHALAARGRFLPLTTTFLSTTNSVLSTIWTAHPPIEHGLLAYEMFIREWAMAVESIGFSSVHEPFAGTLLQWDFDPEMFLPVDSVSQILAKQELPVYSVTQKRISSTPLSRMHFREAREVFGYGSVSEFWFMLRKVLREHQNERFVLSGYWSAVDSLAHQYGPLDESGDMETVSIATLMEQLFFDRLAPADCEGTLLLLTADHGQITTPPESAILLDEHPVLNDGLLLRPLGESRVPFFYVRSGQYDNVWSYLTTNFSEQFVFMSRSEVLERGLLGPGKLYAEVPHRLGDIVGLARGHAFFERSKEGRDRLRGRHGGLTPQEMLVPLLALRLDS